MENQFLDQGVSSNSGGGLSSLDKDHLNTSAYWARFIGIVGYVGSALIALLGLFMMFSMGSIMSALGNDSDTAIMGSAMGALGAMGGVFYLIIAAVYFFLSHYLYKFGTSMRRAFVNSDGDTMTKGLENLKSYFKLSGILLAIFVVLYGLIILFAIIGGLFAASR